MNEKSIPARRGYPTSVTPIPKKSPPVQPTFQEYYKLGVAVNFAHFKNPNIPLTPEAIVHYAAGGLLELLTHAPRPECVLLIDGSSVK